MRQPCLGRSLINTFCIFAYGRYACVSYCIKTFYTLTQTNMIQTITQLRKVCIAGCAIALCSLGLQAQDAELVKLSLRQPEPQELRADDASITGESSIPAGQDQLNDNFKKTKETATIATVSFFTLIILTKNSFIR